MTAIAVTIAGSDSGGGAGIQADLKTFSALGVYGSSVVTALTAQNTLGVYGVHNVPAEFVAKQIDAVFSDLAVNAVKIGMLSEPDVIEVVSERLRHYNLPFIVFDPVMVATSGDKLISDNASEVLIATLLKEASLITPNLDEAAALTNTPRAETASAMEKQAEVLLKLGANGVLLKGGHSTSDQARDLFLSHEEKFWLEAERIDTKNTHGTGCTLSSAIAAEIAKGANLHDALYSAKTYVTGAIKRSDRLDVGKGHGPTHHFHEIW